MKTSPEGFWQDGNSKDYFPRLESDEHADIVIIGGGLLGMWTALDLRRMWPDARVVLLEEERCGWGPSGRNGGIAYDYWTSLPLLSKTIGWDGALSLAGLSEELMASLPEEFAGDIEYRRNGALHISTSADHDDAAQSRCQALREAGREDLFSVLNAHEVHERVRSPLFRGGTYYPSVATLNPGLLVAALRDKIVDEGVIVYERTAALHVSGGVVRAPRGEVRAEKVLLAAGSLGHMAPRNQLTISSSTMVATEPVPEILEIIGWTGGEAITDERKTVRYMQTTADGRIAFGWGRGEIGGMNTLRDQEKNEYAAVMRSLVQVFPELWETKIDYAWGGPIDISPTHLPFLLRPDQNTWQAGGFTGNGLCGTRVLGHIIAAQMAEKEGIAASQRLPEPPRLPPEPLRTTAASWVRSSLLRREAAEEAGEKPKTWDKFLTDLPARFGVEIGR